MGFDLSYSVTENVKERDITPRPTLTMLLAKGEEFLFGETGIEPAGNGEAFKNWLAASLGRLDRIERAGRFFCNHSPGFV